MGDDLGQGSPDRWQRLYATTDGAFLPENYTCCRVDPYSREFFVPELILDDGTFGASSWPRLMKYLDNLGFTKFPAVPSKATEDTSVASIACPGSTESSPPQPAPVPPLRLRQGVQTSLPTRQELFDVQSHQLFTRELPARPASNHVCNYGAPPVSPRVTGRAASSSSVLLRDGSEVHLSPRQTPRSKGADIQGRVVQGTARTRVETAQISAGMICTPRSSVSLEAVRNAEIAAEQARHTVDSAPQVSKPAVLCHTTSAPPNFANGRSQELILQFDAAHRRSITWQQRTADKQRQERENLGHDPIDLLHPMGNDQAHEVARGEGKMPVGGRDVAWHADRVLNFALTHIVVPEEAPAKKKIQRFHGHYTSHGVTIS